ncbi:hypothetical protein FB45DRAFT_887096 [Roridomyces roridus]|uniref:Uncharacterized protein n=1 Tax=Roridomyces roridus TaxID=1738132 RepID=A0AAD7CIU4_9AGAR|nr:hypothetical protein FB45DRAFT_887096 [Roridomyces roridus]
MYALKNITRRAAAVRASSVRFTSTMHDNDPDVLDLEKGRNLSGLQYRTSTPHKGHAPGWNEHLASASEASVKADKDVSSPDMLQKSTVDYIHARHSPDESHLLRDEVDGPLSSAEGTEGLGEPQVLVRKTIEKTEMWSKDNDQTASEDIVSSPSPLLLSC